MGYGAKRDWKATDGRPGLAVARGDRGSTGCAGKGCAGKSAADHILAAHGRKPFWAGSGATDARGNVRGAERTRGHGKPSPRHASSRVVRELELATGVGADDARSV